MRATSTLQRTLAHATVGTHRAMRSRDRQAMYYELAERQQQFQYPISGTVGLVPVETTITIKFDIQFLYEYGYRRDSQLLEPLTHFGFTSVTAPAGTIPFAHVKEWTQDEDLNYVGAKVVVGVHNPIIAASGAAILSSAAFKATLHCSFQGYGTPLDPDQSSDNPSVDSQNEALGLPVAPQAPAKTIATPADFAPGPLGGSDWTVVASYPTGSISDFAIPSGEGALIINDGGWITCRNETDVSVLVPPTIPGGGEVSAGQPGIVPGRFRGDKYAANWTSPGKVGDQHKVRWKVGIAYGWSNIFGVTIGMRDRQNGLAFAFGSRRPVRVDWVNDLRCLGDVQIIAGVFPNSQPYASTWDSGEGAPIDLNRLTDFGADPVRLDAAMVATTARLEQTTGDVWVELWRNGDYLVAGIYFDDPGSGASPAYESATNVSGSAAYGPGADVYFGFTRDSFGSSGGQGPGVNGSEAHKIQGISEITLYRR